MTTAESNFRFHCYRTPVSSSTFPALPPQPCGDAERYGTNA
jgi:hypothetical protein